MLLFCFRAFKLRCCCVFKAAYVAAQYGAGFNGELFTAHVAGNNAAGKHFQRTLGNNVAFNFACNRYIGAKNIGFNIAGFTNNNIAF